MRRNIIPLAAALAAIAAAIAVMPVTGVAGQIEQAAAGASKGIVHRVDHLFNAVDILRSRIGVAKVAIHGLQAGAASQQGDIDTLKGDITTINGQLSAGAATTTAIINALQDPTTGLVGLNKARPQFGAFQNNGNIIAGTGQVSGASGPSANATHGGGSLANLYVVDFGNDVSLRFLSVTQFPTGGLSTNRAAMAVDCAASASASTLCGAVEGVASDSSKNHVVVQFGSAGPGAAAADTSWEVAALSG